MSLRCVSSAGTAGALVSATPLAGASPPRGAGGAPASAPPSEEPLCGFPAAVPVANRQAVRVAADLTDVDVAIVGAGGAGLSLVIALERAARAAGVEAPSIALFDPVHRREPDRTWCWWMPADSPTRPGLGPNGQLRALDPLLTRSWSRLELIDRAGRSREHDLGQLRYVMLRSSDFYAEADAALRRLGAEPAGPGQPGQAARVARITVGVEGVDDGIEVAVVRAGPDRVRARWV